MRTFLKARAPREQDALTIYSAGPGGLIRQLVQGFTARTGWPVEVFQATTGRVVARLEAESASPSADIFISASWDIAMELEAQGWFAPLDVPAAAALPAQLRSRCCVTQGVSVLGIVWHCDSGTPAPCDWEDLADPVYRDRITSPDPALSGASVDLLLGLQQALGERAWALFEALRRNNMLIAGANAQALAPVLRGERELVFGSVDYIARDSIEQGAPIRFILPRRGTVIAPRAMTVLRTSQRMAQAVAFIDYVLSDEGQAIVARAGLLPARLDVRPAQGRALRDVPLLTHEAPHDALRRDVLARFAALFN